MRLTCQTMKRIMPTIYHSRIYKSGGETRINLMDIKDEIILAIREKLKDYSIEMYRDDFVHKPEDYIVQYIK